MIRALVFLLSDSIKNGGITPEHRVIKAPSTFLAFNELEAEIEIYRDQDKNQITRFTSTCPTCAADVVLRSGQPD